MTLPATVRELLVASPPGTRRFRLPQLNRIWYETAKRAPFTGTIHFRGELAGGFYGWTWSGPIRLPNGQVIPVEDLAVEWDLPRCKSGKHTWLDQEDADRCCNPDYRRDLRLFDGLSRHVWVRVADGKEERPTRWIDQLS